MSDPHQASGTATSQQQTSASPADGEPATGTPPSYNPQAPTPRARRPRTPRTPATGPQGTAGNIFSNLADGGYTQLPRVDFSRMDACQFTTNIKAVPSWAALAYEIDMVQKKQPELLNHIHVAAAFARLAQLHRLQPAHGR